MKDWKKDTPFPRHWLLYVTLKVGVLLLAVYLALRVAGYV
jgi:hypothetical protein